MENTYDVGYGTLDAFKRLAQAEARKTDGNIERLGLKVVEWSRGESVFLVEHPDCYIGHVNEGLGTKNDAADQFSHQLRVAEEMEGDAGFETSHYAKVAQCSVATIVNDMATLGVTPVTLSQHLAVGHADWFKWGLRNEELAKGWKSACDLARCVWGPGETPALRDLIIPDKAVISGSADGIVKPKDRLVKRDIRDGDQIVILESSGIHANGLTFARDLAKELPDGYLTQMPDGRTYGEALLDPTHLYPGFVDDCLDAGLEIHYGVNVTGHGWRKLMRAPEKFRYEIERLPAYHPVFGMIERHGKVSRRNMFKDFNCGAGFMLYMPKWDAHQAIRINEKGGYPFEAFIAGSIKADSKSSVHILPENFEPFREDELEVR